MNKRLMGLSLAIGLVIVMASIKSFFSSVIGVETSFLLFFSAIMLSAFYGGRAGGLLATVLSLASIYVFDPPKLSLESQLIRGVLFSIEGTTMTLVIYQRTIAQKRLERHIADLRRVQSKLAETNHRALVALDDAMDWRENDQPRHRATKADTAKHL